MPGTLEDVTLEYLPGGVDVERSLDVNSVFTYSDTIYPINSCSFHQANDCDGPTFTSTDDLTVSSSLPTPIVSASVTNEQGYSYALCLRCSNGILSADLDNWRISQIKNPCTPGITSSQFDMIKTIAAFAPEIGSFSFPVFTEGCGNEISYEIGTEKKSGVIPKSLFKDVEQEDDQVNISIKPYLSEEFSFYLHASALNAQTLILGPITIKVACQINSAPELWTGSRFKANQQLIVTKVDTLPAFTFPEFLSDCSNGFPMISYYMSTSSSSVTASKLFPSGVEMLSDGYQAVLNTTESGNYTAYIIA